MKTIRIIAILCLFFIFKTGIAQEHTAKKIRRISIQELYVQPGLLIQADKSVNLEDFNKLNAPTLFKNSDYSSFNSGYSESISANTTSSVLIGIKFRNKEKTDYRTNPVLRIGIHTCSGLNLSRSLFKETTISTDTFISSTTGEEFYLDSIKNEYVNISYQSRQLRLDASLIFNIHPQNRWSFYYGFGVNAGFSTNSEIEIQYNKSNKIDGEIIETSIYQFNGSSSIYERTPQQTNTVISIYTPIGMNFRIGKPGRKWENIFLYYEIRPMVNITSIPQLQTFTSSAFQQGIGMKFNL